MSGTMGNIYDIKRFTAHDGPGIRSLVFFKGCPLRCRWCANPESQQFSSQLMFYKNKCAGCGKCIAVCPNAAVLRDETFGFIAEGSKCNACGICAEACLYGAREIIGKMYTVEEVLSAVLKDSMHYDNSGGGVTLTGGEPFMQPEFIFGLLKALKAYSVNIAVETSGYTKWEYIERALPYIDLIYFDLKHIDGEAHKEYTGVSAEPILRNLKKLNSGLYNGELVIRVPFIPGVNSSDEVQSHIFSYLSGLKSVERVEIMPYHRLGSSKYEGLGLQYGLKCVEPVEKDGLKYLTDMGKRFGLKVQVDAK
jgi:pyruvate formate lyase activating enzyme